MNKYSIEFYNKVAGRKKLSEVFLGSELSLEKFGSQLFRGLY